MKVFRLIASIIGAIHKWRGVTNLEKVRVLSRLLKMRLVRTSENLSDAYVATASNTNTDQSHIMDLVWDKEKLRILLVDHEASVGLSGIVSRIASELYQALLRIEGVDVQLSPVPKSGFDVVHHFIYTMACPTDATVTTTMITHIDSIPKMNKVGNLINEGVRGICMSNHTKTFIQEQLDDYSPDSLYVVLPVPMFEGVRKRIRLAYVSNSYPDGRKRENVLVDGLQELDTSWCEIDLMGNGLEDVYMSISKLGFEVRLHRQFDFEIYSELLRYSDYFLYLGLDEGAISILDACAAGVEVIVTDQGFHRELFCERTHFVTSRNDLATFLNAQINNRRKQSEIAFGNGWSGFALDHLNIWKNLLSKAVN